MLSPYGPAHAATQVQHYSLHYAAAATPLVLVVPDGRWRKVAWAREAARSPLVRLTAEKGPP
jgi:hypothetical protein